MTIRLDESILRGEIHNGRRNKVHGWLLIEGIEMPVMLELTGNCAEDLYGKSLRFERRDGSMPGKDASHYRLAPHQIGCVKLMTAKRLLKDLPCSPEEYMRRAELGEAPPAQLKPCLTLEWYSQNGRMLIEMMDPVMEFFDPKNPIEEGEPIEIGDIPFADDEENTTLIEMHGEVFEVSQLADSEPDAGREINYGDALPDELRATMDEETSLVEQLLAGEGGDITDDELQEEMMRLADKLLTEYPGEPVGTLFKPQRLPKPEDVTEEEAEELVMDLIRQLALYAVGIHVCEHYTWRDTYRFLIEEIIWNQRVAPSLKNSGWTQNFMTSESCEKCEEEAERRYQEWKDEQEEN